MPSLDEAIDLLQPRLSDRRDYFSEAVAVLQPAGAQGGASSIDSAIDFLERPVATPPAQPGPVQPPPAPEAAPSAGGGLLSRLAPMAAQAVQAASSPFMPPKAPTSIAEGFELARSGQADVPAGPAAFTEPTALLQQHGGRVKDAVGAALEVEKAPKAGVFSKVLGKLLMAPTEMALGVPPGFLGKVEDAIGEKAISQAGQEVLRQAVLSAPFKPSEFQEEIGAVGLFDIAIPRGLQGLLARFPGMAGRLGFAEAGEAVQEAVRRGVKVPVTPDDMKAFFSGVGELDPAVASKLKDISGTMDPKKFHGMVKDVLAGKRKFFVEVEPTVVTGAKKELPGPGAVAPEAQAKSPIDQAIDALQPEMDLPKPPATGQGHDLVKLKSLVEGAGADYVGVWKVSRPGMEDMVTFNHRGTNSTLTVPMSQATPEGIAKRLRDHEAEWASAIQPSQTATPGTETATPPAISQPPAGSVPTGGTGAAPIETRPPLSGQAVQPNTAPAVSGPAPALAPSKAYPLPQGTYDKSITQDVDFIKASNDADAVVRKYAAADKVDPSPEYAKELWNRLHYDRDSMIMRDPGTPAAERVAAAKRLLARNPDYGAEWLAVNNKNNMDMWMQVPSYPLADFKKRFGGSVVLRPKAATEGVDLPSGGGYPITRETPAAELPQPQKPGLGGVRPSGDVPAPAPPAPGGVAGPGPVSERSPSPVSGEITKPPEPPSKGGGAYEISAPSGGGPSAPPAAEGDDIPPPIELPELVEMAKGLLAGKTPKVMESLLRGKARGLFSPGHGEIRLAADIAKDPAGAAKTLAHEIGHARDWLSDKTMAKGNILGRIASVPGYIKDMLKAVPDQPGEVLTPVEREKIRQSVVSDILKKMGKTVSQFIADPALKKSVGAQVPPLYKERLAAEAKTRGLVTKEEVMAELKAVTQKWKPFDEKANAKFTAYRYSPEELYADATSVLFNDPALLKRMAPKFYKSLFAYIDRKPDVKASYDKIVERIRGGGVEEGREEGMEEMFEAGERQAASERLATQKTARDIVEALRDELIDKNEGVLAYVRKAKKAGKVIRPEDSPQYALEEMNYISSETKAYLETANELLKKLNEAGIPWRRLDHLMFHERVINERGELFNPRGFTPETSQRQLDHARKRIGEGKWKVLTEAARRLREKRMDKIVPMMKASGMFTPELVRAAETRPYYATFDVFSKHAEEAAGGSGIGAAIHGQVGTLQDVSGPATATLMKDVALIKAIRRNEAAKKTVEFLAGEFGPSAIHPAETRWTGRYHEPLRPKDPSKGLLAYMEAGKIKAFVVDRYVAKAFERDPGEASAVVEAARLAQRFFREVFTQKNPGFQLFNLWRDYFRAYKNLPGMSFAGLTRHYIRALSPAFKRGFNIPDPLVREMLEKKMLITVEDKWGLSTEDEQVRALMDRYFGNRVKEDPTLKDKFAALIKWVGDIGSAIEAMPKVAGYRYLKEHQKDLGLSDQEVAHMIRGQVGSPDFMRKGRGYSWYNNIFMFSNAIKEGWRSDIEVFRSRPWEYGWKTLKGSLLPKLVMLGGAVGMMGAGMKDMMDGVPEYDKTNYLVIPLGKTPQGRTVYFRLPQDEAGRFISGLFWKVMRRDAGASDLMDYMAGQAPTLNPILDAVRDTVFYTSGKNPYDFFRQRNVIGEQEFEAGGWRSHRLFLKHLANTLGAGVVHNFKTSDLQKVKTELEEGLGLPIASNIIGRFIKVSDYGKAEMIRREAEKSRKSLARERLDERDAMVMHLNAVDRPGPADAAKLYADMVKVGMLRRGRGTAVVTMSEFMKDYNRFAQKKGADPYINALIYARSNEERADLLEYYRKTMPKADYDKLVGQVTADGTLSAKPLILSYIEEKKQ